MDAVDASAHYEVTAAEETPALLTIILDTNPRAWAALANTLPLSKAVANILVFANSHLALSSTNQVAVVASHCRRAVWLYPAEPGAKKTGRSADGARSDPGRPSANKFPQFREIETILLQSVHDLVSTTTAHDLEDTTTQLSGALTLALAHINKTALAGGGKTKDGGSSKAKAEPPSTTSTADPDADASLHARILVVSVSDSSPAQYIPTMNAVFAAAHAGVALDVLALRGTATFLQQAAYITRGTFVAVEADTHPGRVAPLHGLLAYLMLGFSAASAHDVAQCLVAPSADAVDFRAACFCHRRVVDTGFVCSICLSIFCEVPGGTAAAAMTNPSSPPTAECLTCGSRLRLGNYGARPAVVPRPKKKKKRKLVGGGREETASAVGTPSASWDP